MLSNQSEQTNRTIIYIVLALLLGLGLWLRWRFIHTVHLYPDEFVTLLAVRMIGQKGVPVMPSGLFYEHGLLFSYLGSLAALFGPVEVWVRYASLLIGLVTIGLIFFIGQRWFSPAVGLIAAAGLAIAPTAILWSGRARMYALLQLLVLLTLWLAYEGLIQNRATLRWLALLSYLGATLTHFAAVTLALPLVLAGVVVGWLHQVGEQGGRGAGEQGSGGAGECDSPYQDNNENENRFSAVGGRRSAVIFFLRQYWAEAIALVAILLIAFLVKRAGQPKGIEALDSSNAVSGVVEVFNIYSDFSFNLLAGWAAIAPFYLTLPALIFSPFAVVAMVVEGWRACPEQSRRVGWLIGWKAKEQGSRGAEAQGKAHLQSPISNLPTFQPSIFLSLILLLTTFEIILLVSPDRRDAKYVFMLLPPLLLLGAQGMAMVGNQLAVISNRLSVIGGQLRVIKNPSPVTDYWSLVTDYWSLVTGRWSLVITVGFIALLLWLTRPDIEALLANTGDDYEAAFAYVQAHWQEGDKVMTGTPAAAALYLGRNDFYSVQKRGGYDYRLLTVEGQAVDRWLASPAIRTEAALSETLSNHTVWLILERWGLQREYYDLPFQQQLLAQTEPQTEAQAQGIFVLRSKANPQAIVVKPAHAVEAIFGNQVRLIGYTLEPETPAPGQLLRLTLYWQATTPMPHDYTVFVHLRRPNGGNVAQADHRPLGELYPTSLWPVGETIRERSELYLPEDLAPGVYDLWVGMYLLETGERLPVQHDTSGENAVRLGVVEVLE